MTTEVVEYSATEAALANLAQKYKGVLFDCTTRAGMATALDGRAELRGLRVTLEKTRKEIKEPALRRAQLIDSEARRITAALEALENPIDAQIKKEQDRKEFLRTAAIRAEQERVAAEARAKKEAEERQLAEARAKLEAEQAELARQQAAQREAEDNARRERELADRVARAQIEAAERESRERIAAEQQAAAEKEEAARKVRQAEEDRLRAERDRIDAERKKLEAEAERKEREKREAEEEAARQVRAAEEARQRAERERLEAEQRAKDEEARKAREAEEAKQREIQRQKNETSDFRAMCLTMKERFGHRRDAAPIIKAIDAYLAPVKKTRQAA